ncbi:MAG TPA: uracil-DNA glycosylase, partial [Verrucomicrobiae bacterium]|nr:uracil-DNA glycosylase [Verrucomicrobiae bacterium]
MSAEYNQLLDATIQHLEGLKARGVRHVAVTPDALRALSQPVRPGLAASFRQQMSAAVAAPAVL